MPPTSSLRAPTRSRVFTHLLTSGITILAVGLAVPFVVADPAPSQEVAFGAPQAVNPAAQAPGASVPGTASPGTAAPAPTTPGTATPTIPATGSTGTATAPSPAGPSTTTRPAATSGTTSTAPAAPAPAPAPAAPAPAPAGPAQPTAGPTTPAAPTPTQPAQLTASDTGVTPEVISLGILIPEEIALDGGGSSGDFVGDLYEQWTVAIEQINNAGGINGRALEPVFREFDGLDADSMRAACIYLTEEVGVFAVVNAGGFYGDPILCVAEQHQTPFIGQAGEIQDFYTRAGGMYVSTTLSKERALLNAVQRMYEEGYFEGRTVGIVEQEGIDRIPVDNAMVPLLNQLGVPIAHRATFSEDFAAAQAQMPIQISQMRSAGVDTVLLPVGLGIGGLFVSQADTQGYRPQYWTSDFASGTSDVYATLMNDGFDGALGYTALRTGEAIAGMDEAPLDRGCRERFEAQTGRGMDRSTIEYYSMVTACGIMDMFTRAATAAGPELTRVGLSNALQGLGPVDVPYSGSSSLGPGKLDAPDAVRLVQFSSSCRCWQPAGDFVATSY